MDFNQWITLEELGKFAQALVVLRFGVEYTKDGIDSLAGRFGLSVPTKLYSYLFALLGILIPYKAFTGALSLQSLYLDVINAFLLSIAAGFMQKPKVSMEDAAAALGLTLASPDQQGDVEAVGKEPIGFKYDQADDEDEPTI